MPILAIEPNIYPVNLLDRHDFNEFLQRTAVWPGGCCIPGPVRKKAGA